MRRWLLVLMLLAVPASALAQSSTPITRFTMSGPPGEYITQGQTWTYTPDEAHFQLEQSPALNGGLRCWIYNNDQFSGVWWDVYLGSADGSLLAVGRYDDAQRFSFAAPGHSRLEIYGMGRGCNELAGWFEVKHIRYYQGGIIELWVVGEQQCEPGSPIPGPLRFEMMFQMDRSTPVAPKTWGQVKALYR